MKLTPKFSCLVLLTALVFFLALPSKSSIAKVDKRVLQEIEILENELESDPTDINKLKKLAKRYGWVKKGDKAIEVYEKILEINPQDLETAKALKDFYGWQGMDDKAILILQNLIELEPNDASHHQEIAVIYQRKNMPEKAIEHYEKVTQLQPRDMEAKKTLGAIYVWAGRPEDAIRVYEDVLKRDPKDSTAKAMLENLKDKGYGLAEKEKAEPLPLDKAAKEAARKKRYEQEIEEYKVKLESDPANIELMMKLAARYRYISQPKNAIPIYERVLKTEPDNAEALKQLKACYDWAGEREKLVQMIEKELEKDPNNIELQQELAKNYSRIGEKKKAIGVYETLLSLMPDNLELRKKVARFKMWNNQQKDAIRDYELILAENPNDLETKELLANLYTWNRMGERAIPHYEEILEINPDNFEVKERLAYQYLWNGNAVKAGELFNEMLETDPNNIEAKKGLAEVYAHTEAPERAINEYLTLVDMAMPREEKTDMYRKVGDTYYRTQSYRRAKKYYEQVLADDPENVKAKEKLAKVKRKLSPEIFGEYDIFEAKGGPREVEQTIGFKQHTYFDVDLRGHYLHHIETEEGKDRYRYHYMGLELNRRLKYGITGTVGGTLKHYEEDKTFFDYHVRFSKTFFNRLTARLSYEREIEDSNLDALLQRVFRHTFEQSIYYDIHKYFFISGYLQERYYTKGRAPDDNYALVSSYSPTIRLWRKPDINLSYIYYRVDHARKDADPFISFYDYYAPKKSETHSASLAIRHQITDYLEAYFSDTISYTESEDRHYTRNTIHGRLNLSVWDHHEASIRFIHSRQIKHQSDSYNKTQQLTVNYSYKF